MFYSEKYSGVVKRKNSKMCKNEILVIEVNYSEGGGATFG
tara:strand:+ start:517 stop:636 length:120 start_codon:yes stop_codon:yes gene_type:complete